MRTDKCRHDNPVPGHPVFFGNIELVAVLGESEGPAPYPVRMFSGRDRSMVDFASATISGDHFLSSSFLFFLESSVSQLKVGSRAMTGGRLAWEVYSLPGLGVWVDSLSFLVGLNEPVSSRVLVVSCRLARRRRRANDPIESIKMLNRSEILY